ncbi:MAG: hypothetical protein Q4E86_05270 [Lachnospiraceae bacterium]|nr:hypothetical protein [Lachnospiraceae bacterium]MDO5551399.1 hypothetical protein [Lachnospiraceae bacterium]
MICMKLVIDGNAVYEIDEDCMERRRRRLEELERRQGNGSLEKTEETKN